MHTYKFTVTKKGDSQQKFILYFAASNRAEAEVIAKRFGKGVYRGTFEAAHLQEVGAVREHVHAVVDPFAQRKARVQLVKELTADKPTFNIFARRLHRTLRATDRFASWQMPPGYREDYFRAIDNKLNWEY